MTVRPFAPGAYVSNRSADLFVSMRGRLDGLQHQLATGKTSDTFGGLGFERRSSLDFRAKLASIAGYTTAIDGAKTRMTLMTQVVQRLDAIGRNTQADTLPPKFDIGQDGQTPVQRTAAQRMSQAIDGLNQELNGRYLFSGRSTDQQPVESYDKIINGDPATGAVGLKQVIAERKAADRGDGYGRTTFVNDGTAKTLDLRTTDALPFGLKLVSLTGSLTGASFSPSTVAGDTGVTIDFTAAGQPAPGDSVNLVLSLPDGSRKAVTFTAQAPTDTPVENGFVADPADEDATRTNLFNAMRTAIAKVADTDLAAVSALKASGDFFFAPPATGPTRVVGTPATATATAVGTAADTVLWYKGDSDPTVSARDTAPLRLDTSQVVGTGARANEPAVRSLLAQLGVLSTETFANTPAGKQRFETLTDQIRTNLSPPAGAQKIQDIATDLGTAISTMQGAKERHDGTKAMLEDALGKVEDASTEELAASILNLQNRLQASYQTTAMLSKLSLVNYL